MSLAPSRSPRAKGSAGEGCRSRAAIPGGRFRRVLASYGLKGQSVMVTDSTILQKQLIEADFGIGLMASRLIAEDIAAGRLAAVHVPAMRAALPVVLVRRKGAHAGSAVQRLMDRIATAYHQARPAAAAAARRPAKR